MAHGPKSTHDIVFTLHLILLIVSLLLIFCVAHSRILSAPAKPTSVRLKHIFDATTTDGQMTANFTNIMHVPITCFGDSVFLRDSNNKCLKQLQLNGKNIELSTFRTKGDWDCLACLDGNRFALFSSASQLLEIMTLTEPEGSREIRLGKRYGSMLPLDSSTFAAVALDSKGIDVLTYNGELHQTIGTSERVRRACLSQNGSLVCTYGGGILKIDAQSGCELLKKPVQDAGGLMGVAVTRENNIIVSDYKNNHLHLLDADGNFIRNLWSVPKDDLSGRLCCLSLLGRELVCCTNRRVFFLELV